MITVSNSKHWLQEQADKLSDRIAVISNNKSMSYGNLFFLAKQTAVFFNKIGIESEDHVAIISNHGLDFYLSVNALWFIGAVPVVISDKMNKREVAELFNQSKCKVLIDLNNGSYISSLSNSIKIQLSIEKISNQYDDFLVCDYDPSAVCLMLFTSGSTGTPKCVQLTFRNLLESTKSADHHIQHNIYDFWIASLPFYHIGGFSILTRGLISGCSVVIPKSLKLIDLINCIKQYKPSMISLVPTMFQGLLNELKVPWKNLRHLFLGGSKVSDQLISEALKNLWPVAVVYGSTETSSMVTLCSTQNLEINGLSVGEPLPGVEIQIEKKTQDILGSGKIIISSKAVAKSYFNEESEVNKSLINGRYFSNDIGSIDDKGNLHIFGRSDDIIISGGENISLTEIESLLANNFMEVIAIEVDDEKWGQSYVLFTDSEEVNIVEKIKKYLESNLSRYKLPQQIVKVMKIPRTELGKVKKEELKKLLNSDFL